MHNSKFQIQSSLNRNQFQRCLPIWKLFLGQLSIFVFIFVFVFVFQASLNISEISFSDACPSENCFQGNGVIPSCFYTFSLSVFCALFAINVFHKIFLIIICSQFIDILVFHINRKIDHKMLWIFHKSPSIWNSNNWFFCIHTEFTAYALIYN